MGAERMTSHPARTASGRDAPLESDSKRIY